MTPKMPDVLIEAAADLFYCKGVRAVGMDEIAARARIGIEELNRIFPTKDDLVVAYLQDLHGQVRAGLTTVMAGLPPYEALQALFDEVADYVCRPRFHGSPLINAANEYDDPAHPVRQVVADHRSWFLRLLEDLLSRLDPPRPRGVAQALLMLYDGAVATGYLSNLDATRTTLQNAITTLLGTHPVAEEDTRSGPS
ncbi:TetR/AcrR family transcriptional regulator [Kitasatospora sp. NPDC048540]|uniref:TetR/AcrR family transcriptional regulator n=1 Tax=unclassified Kitasatospora TaxID=2633591 RepID=UPI000A42FA11|nr:TetR/AcrR family transcriptional regulator [Kitasatospora sp. MBT63]